MPGHYKIVRSLAPATTAISAVNSSAETCGVAGVLTGTVLGRTDLDVVTRLRAVSQREAEGCPVVGQCLRGGLAEAG
jgi:hypothetical protein